MFDQTLVSFCCSEVVFKIGRFGGWNGTFPTGGLLGGGDCLFYGADGSLEISCQLVLDIKWGDKSLTMLKARELCIQEYQANYEKVDYLPLYD